MAGKDPVRALLEAQLAMEAAARELGTAEICAVTMVPLDPWLDTNARQNQELAGPRRELQEATAQRDGCLAATGMTLEQRLAAARAAAKAQQG